MTWCVKCTTVASKYCKCQNSYTSHNIYHLSHANCGSSIWSTTVQCTAFLMVAMAEIQADCYNYYNRFTTLCLGLPRWVGTRRINHSGFCWSRHDGVAVASAEPYASYLHFAPEDNHASTSTVKFLRTRCPSWHPTNSIKALKAINTSRLHETV